MSNNISYKASNSSYRFPSILLCLLCAIAVRVSAQPQGTRATPAQTGASAMVLDVVVTQKNGAPQSGMQQQDFTVLDDKRPQTITSFQAIDGRTAPIQVIVAVDAVNTDLQHVGYERDQIDKFLRAEAGHLAHPTIIQILTDQGLQALGDFSTDGNALSTTLDQATIGLRTIHRDAGFYGDAEKYQISLQALQKLTTPGAGKQERKLILWVSPGWPLLSGANVELTEQQHQDLFRDIVTLSHQLWDDRATLYSFDPLGTADAARQRAFFWQEFQKGVSKPDQAQGGNLALQVLATQSGGIAFASNNDIAGELEKGIADAGAYYEISFDPPTDNKPNEYHSLEVRVAKPGLTARTRQGYYAAP